MAKPGPLMPSHHVDIVDSFCRFRAHTDGTSRRVSGIFGSLVRRVFAWHIRNPAGLAFGTSWLKPGLTRTRG